MQHGESAGSEVTVELGRAPEVDPEGASGEFGAAPPAAEADDDALAQAKVGQDVAQLRHDVLLDRLLPRLALDRDAERRERIGLLGQHVDLVSPARSTFQHHVGARLVAVRGEVARHALLEMPAAFVAGRVVCHVCHLAITHVASEGVALHDSDTVHEVYERSTAPGGCETCFIVPTGGVLVFQE